MIRRPSTPCSITADMTGSGGDLSAGRSRPTAHFGARISYVFILAVLLFCFAAVAPRMAWAQASPRAALHEGYSRIVFDWDAPVGFSAEIVNGQLLVRFDRPIQGDIKNLAKPLASVVSGIQLSSDRKSASFALLRPMTVSSKANGNNAVVIDLTEPAPPPAAALPLMPSLDARAGDHGSYVRLVFDWPGPVGYSVESQAGRASVAFTKPAKLDQAGLKAGLPADVVLTAADNGAKGLTVSLQIPSKARLRHFASGNKVVVDVVRSDPSAPDQSGRLTPAPALDNDVAMPALQPLTPAKTALTPVKPIPEPKPLEKPALTAAPAPAESPIPAPAKSVAKVDLPPGKVFSLSIAMTRPAAAAVFQRAGYLWIILDRRQEVDTALLRRLGGDAVLSVEQLSNKDATVLRLVVQPDYYPNLRKEGLLWVIDLTQQFNKPKDIIAIVAPANLPSGIGMSIKAPDSGGLISVTDPEVGDVIKVVPVLPLSQGVYPGRDSPDVEVLATAQGIAIVPHVDGLDIRSTRSGVTIGTVSGAGLRFSSELDRTPRDQPDAGSSGLFDIAAWKRGGPDSFEANQKIITNSLNGVSASRRALANLQAARFYFANGYGAEAIGLIHLAALDQPDLANQPGFKALKGGAELLLGQTDLAVADLDSPDLQGDPEIQMWRGAAHTALEAAADGTPAAWNKLLAAGMPLIRAYPHRLKWLMASLAAQSAVAAGDDQAANAALIQLDREEPTKFEAPEREYLHGTYDQMAGHFDRALDDFDSAADSDNREYRAMAKFAETELMLRTHKISPKEAADQLDKLRFSWREQAFEFHLLYRYAELQREAGDFPSALRALKSLISYYPDDKDTPRAVQLMQDIFNALYLDGQADSMPPVSAIALFDEFKELTPQGPKGDEMIRKLADRLAKVDLLDRAAELLKHQVTFRLQGVERARVGAQLALLDLVNQQPQAALDGLAISDQAGLPIDLDRQRRHLRARALGDLDHTAEAIATLEGDTTPEAVQLRSEIHWKAQDWPAAAVDFEAMLPRPERGAKLDDQAAKICLNWATALVLANDERSLAALRRNFFPAIAGTPYQEGFNLLTSALDRDTPNLPTVIAKIKEVEGFKSFLDDYRKRLQSDGLSAIN